jgi:hypothetical protein
MRRTATSLRSVVTRGASDSSHPRWHQGTTRTGFAGGAVLVSGLLVLIVIAKYYLGYDTIRASRIIAPVLAALKDDVHVAIA